MLYTLIVYFIWSFSCTRFPVVTPLLHATIVLVLSDEIIGFNTSYPPSSDTFAPSTTATFASIVLLYSFAASAFTSTVNVIVNVPPVVNV